MLSRGEQGKEEGRTGAAASGGMVWETVRDDCHTYKLDSQGPCSKLEVSLKKNFFERKSTPEGLPEKCLKFGHEIRSDNSFCSTLICDHAVCIVTRQNGANHGVCGVIQVKPCL